MGVRFVTGRFKRNPPFPKIYLLYSDFHPKKKFNTYFKFSIFKNIHKALSILYILFVGAMARRLDVVVCLHTSDSVCALCWRYAGGGRFLLMENANSTLTTTSVDPWSIVHHISVWCKILFCWRSGRILKYPCATTLAVVSVRHSPFQSHIFSFVFSHRWFCIVGVRARPHSLQQSKFDVFCFCFLASFSSFTTS